MGCPQQATTVWRLARRRTTIACVPANLSKWRAMATAESRKTIEWRLRRGELRRPTRGVYAAGSALVEEELAAVFVRLPAVAVLGRRSAAHRLGFEPVPPTAVEILLPPGVSRPRMPGVVVYEAVVPVGEPVLVGGIPCAPPARCAVDLARTLRRMDALPVLDSVLRAGLATPEDLAVEIDRHHGLRGVVQARHLSSLADGRAECRQESQVRLVLIDGGLPRPDVQVWVHDRDGVALFRLDLAYEAAKVGIEYDGVTHLDRERLRHDRDRANWLDAHGWTMRYFTDRDLYRRPRHVVDLVRAALRA
jgi:hypothetical protein